MNEAQSKLAAMNQATDSAALGNFTTSIGGPVYSLGKTSLANLKGVHPKLVAVVQRAIQLTTQDFTVYEGLRTLARQKVLLSQGYTKTLKSKHLTQADGLGHAVDLVPWIQGHPVWDWTGCYKIAKAVDEAATELGFEHNITWGGAWDRTLGDFGGDWPSYAKEVESYKKRHAGVDFLDGPHYQWVD